VCSFFLLYALTASCCCYCRLPEALAAPLAALRKAARQVGSAAADAKLGVNVDEFVERFRWVLKGHSGRSTVCAFLKLLPALLDLLQLPVRGVEPLPACTSGLVYCKLTHAVVWPFMLPRLEPPRLLLLLLPGLS
jgi:hypothetical protein